MKKVLIAVVLVCTIVACSPEQSADSVSKKEKVSIPSEERRGPPPGGERRGPPPDGERRGPPPDGERRGPPPGGERRGPPPDGERRGPPPGDGGKPIDMYACDIDFYGNCIFTGQPHENGLNPGTDNIVNRNGKVLFRLNEAVAVNSLGEILEPTGKPASDGDNLIEMSQHTMTNDEKAFHKVMAVMFPIRNAIMYDIADLRKDQWDQLVSELSARKIKETTYTDGATPRDNYYGIQGIFDLAENPGNKDIHHEVMRFLEEAGLHLLCNVTSDEFAEMLKNDHPEGHDPCKDAGIKNKIPF